MPMQKKTIHVNEKRLRDELHKKGVSLTEASRQLGHSDAYLFSMFAKGNVMRFSDVLAINYLWNIRQEDIEQIEEASPVVQEAKKEVVSWVDYGKIAEIVEPLKIDYDRLAEIIENAVFKAFNKNEQGGKLWDAR